MAARMVSRVGGQLAALMDRLRAGDFNRFFRFAIVGGSGVAVNQGFAALGLVVFAGLVSPGLSEHLAVILGIVVSIFTNFLLNDLWTWGDRAKHGVGHWFRRLSQYYLVAALGSLVQWAVTFTLHEWVFNWHLLITNMFGIGAGILINYHFNNRWTFRDRTAPTELP